MFFHFRVLSQQVPKLFVPFFPCFLLSSVLFSIFSCSLIPCFSSANAALSFSNATMYLFDNCLKYFPIDALSCCRLFLCKAACWISSKLSFPTWNINVAKASTCLSIPPANNVQDGSTSKSSCFQSALLLLDGHLIFYYHSWDIAVLGLDTNIVWLWSPETSTC